MLVSQLKPVLSQERDKLAFDFPVIAAESDAASSAFASLFLLHHIFPVTGDQRPPVHLVRH
jgi:hypothetical protein